MIDFWVQGCVPCKAIAPVIEELAQEMEDSAVIGKMDVNHNPNLSMEYSIITIPALLVFKGGKKVDAIMGVAPKAKIKAVFEKHAVKA